MTAFDATGQNPFEIFDNWITQAEKDNPNNPNAMCLSTVSMDGKPSSRTVLLKEYDKNGFIFYTNSESRKGQDLSKNPYVALNFYWRETQRQVRIEGKIEIVPRAMTQSYFNSRQRGSQIASYASQQSRPLLDRTVYEDRIQELEKQFKNDTEIQCPDHWNGYRVIPSSIELWVEGQYRTHDRFVFKAKNDWIAERLYP
jgi:pyridoxamine 5'-phosphate oxidase